MLKQRIAYAALALQAHPSRRKAIRAYRTLMRLHRAAHRPAPPVDQELEVEMEGLSIRGFGYPQLLHLYKEIFLKRDYAVDLGTSTPTIVDCGSNIGTSIAFFKQQYPAARVIGFEPHPKLFPVLQGNLARNGMGDVQVHDCALGGEPGTVSFYVSENPGSLRSSMRSERGGTMKIQCRCERLSDHLKGLDRVDLLKIDVEGAEKPILEDLRATGLLAKPEQYVIEYHLNVGSDRSDLAATLFLFEQAGYDYSLGGEPRMGRRFQDVLIRCWRARG